MHDAERNAAPTGAIILGGGAAGLFTLDSLRRAGVDAWLLESASLGSGQTICAQGIIHGGAKYSLAGIFTRSARAVAKMPGVWRSMLAGASAPSLRGVRVRSDHCHLWHSRELSSRIGFAAAQAGLRVKPVVISPAARPGVLRGVTGSVLRLDEQVIDPASLIEGLQRLHADRIRAFERDSLQVARGEATIELTASPRGGGRAVRLRPRSLILAAGEGNERLRHLCGLPAGAMQRRSLHQLLVRGESLPWLNGHCVDGASTRVTITSDRDRQGRIVWQVGGQLAEDGVTLDSAAFLARGRDELRVAIPGLFDDGGASRTWEWASYRIDRAEAANAGARPALPAILRDGQIITVWPTKLALAPWVGSEIAAMLAGSASADGRDNPLSSWPSPPVAAPPWDDCREWRRLE